MKTSLKSPALYLAVFLTGAAVLVLEIVAVRILSPYFGNTIFTVSSIIGVILAALSIGYWFGGWLADRHPRATLFYGLIFASGLSVLAIYALLVKTLPDFATSLTLTSGPLVVSLTLFFLPALLLGMLSPFAIKLLTTWQEKIGIGSIAGRVFFFSTVGSILGTLLAGFFLIPRFGVREIVFGIGAVLVAVGFIGLLVFKLREYLLLLAFVGGGFTTWALSAEPPQDSNVLYQKDGLYERIKISEQELGGRPIRFLNQDLSLSGGVFADTGEIVFEYQEYYQLYRTFNLSPKRALLLGGGAYGVASALVRELPLVRVDVVEIEPSLYDLAQEYFLLPKTDRLKNHITDARRYLATEGSSYDLIFADAFHTLFSIPVHLTTQEFFELARSRLAPDGVFVMNVIGSLEPNPSSFTLALIKTFRSVFPASYIFAVKTEDPTERQNIILAGRNQESVADFVKSSLDLKLVDPDSLKLEGNLVLTDNYAPVEYMIAQTLKER